MREIKIKTEPFEFISYESIRILKETGEHAKAVIKGQIKSSCCEEYLDMLEKQNVWIQIKVYGEKEEEKLLFYGLVVNCELEHNAEEKQMTLIAKDGTFLMDQKEHLRVFQDSHDTYAGIFKTVTQEYKNHGVIFPQSAKERLKALYIQYRETDWRFALRMAAELGTVIVPDAYTGGVKYYVGLPRRAVLPLPDDMNYRIRNGEHRTYIIKSRDIYELGEGFVIDERERYIYKSVSTYSQGEMKHEYYLMSQKELSAKPYPNTRLAGSSLMGEVVGIEKDRVRVKVAADEYDCERKKWFIYSTVYSSPDGTGWYCMPERGDMVRLHMPDHHESHAYIISAVHLDTDGGRDNPDHKSFKNKYGKEVLFTPESIVITDNSGSRIELSDEDGIRMETDKMINLNAGDKILIASKGGQLVLSGKRLVKLCQKDTMIKLDEDIMFSGGEFRIQ